MIKLLLLDIDGVMTDGKVAIGAGGVQSKQIDFRDIDAVFEAKRRGLQIGFVTGEDGPVVDYFQERFAPDFFVKACKNKGAAVRDIALQAGLELAEIAYIGDSRHDLEAVAMVGMGMCPDNALPECKAAARWVLAARGGDGAVWEAVQHLIRISAPAADQADDALVTGALQAHHQMIKDLLEDQPLLNAIQSAARVMAAALGEGQQILLCGNGGSAADAQHLATELVSRFYFERQALNAEALTVNTSSLTAIANDYSYDRVFARQIEAKGRPGDVLIGISTSGNSRSVVEAMCSARERGMITVALIGRHEATRIEEYSDYLLKAPSLVTPRIQEAHILIGHILCELIEKSFVKMGGSSDAVQ